jgi:hypothetical protein
MVIPEDETLKFIGRCKNRLVKYYLSAYFVPRGKIFQETMLDFIREWLKIDSTEVVEVERKGGKT